MGSSAGVAPRGTCWEVWVRRSVLVVDDERKMGRAIRRMLQREYDVTVVTSGREALDVFDDQSFDVIVCDLHMPVVSGMKLYGRLKALRPDLQDRMVFITGGLLSEESRRFIDQVDNPLIYKPFGRRELTQAIDRALDEG